MVGTAIINSKKNSPGWNPGFSGEYRMLNNFFTNNGENDMKSYLVSLVLLFSAAVFVSCQESKPVAKAEKAELVSAVVTKEAQAAMTPQAVLDDLMKGNERYRANKLTARDLPAQVSATTSGQSPKAIILSCVDSRVPVEMVFDQGVGDVFVARVAGNAENEDLLGSIEYAVGVAGSKLVMVMGHESCGAVKSGVDKLDVGSDNVTHLLNQFEEAINSVDGKRDSNDKTYLANVVKANVNKTVDDIRTRSNIVRQLEDEGKISVVGTYYSLQDGSVQMVMAGAN